MHLWCPSSGYATVSEGKKFIRRLWLFGSMSLLNALFVVM